MRKKSAGAEVVVGGGRRKERESESVSFFGRVFFSLERAAKLGAKK